MKQKEKEVLLKTFCSLLLYNGYFSHCNKIHKLKTIELDGKDTINNKYPVEICYPCLRPMSSMTDEEREEWTNLFNSELDKLMSIEDEKQAEDLAPNYFAASHSASVDWLNKKMFDYLGLIPMGLAIEAPENLIELS